MSFCYSGLFRFCRYLFEKLVSIFFLVFFLFSFSQKIFASAGKYNNKAIPALIDSLCDRGIDISQYNPDSSLLCFEKACSLSVANNNIPGKVKSLFLKSCILTDFSDYDEAKQCLDKAYPLSIEIGDSLRMASCLNGFALIHLYQNQYDSAQYFFAKMKLLSSEMGHEQLENSALLNLSAIYNETGLFAQSVEVIFQALDYFEKNKIAFETGICYQNLGSAYLGLKDTNLAITYFNKALDKYSEISNKMQFTEVLQSIGVIYMEQDSFVLASRYFNRALHISDSIGYLRGKATTLAQSGVLKIETEQFNEANIDLNSALALSKEINLPDNRDFVLYSFARLYHEQGRENKALSVLDNARANAEAYQNQELLMSIANLKADIYETTADYKNALNEKEKHLALQEKIQGAGNIRKAAMLQDKYDFELKSEQMQAKARLEKERLLARLKLQRTYKTFAVIILVLVSVMLLALFYEYTKKRRAYKKLVKKNLALTKAYVRLEELNDNYIEREKRVNNERMKEILSGLDLLIKEEKIFLDKELTQQKLANMLGTNSSYLSEIINTCYEKNFSTYINEKRIEYALQQLAEGNFKKYSVEGIALASGFSSRSTFHRAFKKITGVSPACYVENAEPEIEEVGFMN